MKFVPLFFSTLLITACAATPNAQADASAPQLTKASHPAPQLNQAQRHAVWKRDFMAEAISKGYAKDLVEAVIIPAKINPLALERDANQPEFSKPVWSYVDGAASASRIRSGKNKLSDTSTVFDAVEARYGVPRNVLTAIWGLETSYGRVLGKHDIVDSLSTFAFEGRRKAFGEEQLYAIFDLLARGDVRQEQLIGAWAGAMGMTQFIPTTFRDYAVDFNGNGNIDLWKDPGDALGSAAHYLQRSGWKTGEPVMIEVKLPPKFDYAVTDGTKKFVNQWTALGVQPVSGRRWNADEGFYNAKLIAPGGSRGPKFLTFKNFDVLRRYNNSTSYVMGISVLADTIGGQSGIRQDWPRNDLPLSFTDKKAMQKRLTELGFDTQGVDGRIGPNSRKAIRAWQAANGLTADGYMEQRLFAKLMGRV